jgi:CxxC motif-containing protein (DUF1111 family)
MKRFYPAWCLFAVLFIFGPVTWRVLSWQRQEPVVVDTDMARAGEMLFKHEWQVNDPLSPSGDGLGPVFNARSCAACHHQGGLGGGGGVEHNVQTYLVLEDDGVTPKREGVVHAQATAEKYRETLSHVHSDLPAISQPRLTQIVALSLDGRGGGELLTLPTNVRLSQRNTPALFGTGLIDMIPDRVILANERAQRLRFAMAPGDTDSLPVGRVHRLAGGKLGRFGWKAQTARLAEFVQAACANELGLGNPGQAQPASMAMLAYRPNGLDLTQLQCDQLTAFVANLPRPVEREGTNHTQVAAGKALFTKVGCADCHTANLGSVEGIYSDLLLHRMGPTLEGGSAYYGAPTPPTTPTTPPDIASGGTTTPLPDEWRTPPLWGVADSAPYMHDGRAKTLKEAIEMHGGQGAGAAKRFERLSAEQQGQVVAFLNNLRAP